MSEPKSKLIPIEAVMPLVAAIAVSAALGLAFGPLWAALLAVVTVVALVATKARNRVVTICVVGAWGGMLLSVGAATILQLLK